MLVKIILIAAAVVLLAGFTFWMYRWENVSTKSDETLDDKKK